MKHRLLLLSALALSIPTTLTAQVQSLVAGNTAFALRLYGELAADGGSSNLFFSPYSISTCLAMLYDGARGNTQAQMSQVLGFSSDQQQLALAFGQLQSAMQADQQTNALQLRIANALWTQVGFPFLPDFLATASDQYQASISQADFAQDANEVAQAINDWVAQETENRIHDIVSADAIKAATRLVLANAVYFLGEWTYAFEPTNTSLQPFYLSSSNQVMAPLMHQPLIGSGQGPAFNYLAASGFQALELPYASNQLSMLLLLPAQIDGLGQLEEQLSPAFLSNVLARMTPQQVEVFLPNFTNASSFDLTETLPQMGMPDAFAPDVADFSGIDGAKDLCVSFVVHRAWCQVNEAGTEAAAATVIGVIGTVVSGTPAPVFRADHPFIYLIRDTRTGSVLFMGRLANPTQSSGVPIPKPRLAITRSANALTISWPYPSTPWVLEQSPNPGAGNWQPVATEYSPASDLSRIGATNFITVAPSQGNRFFRLRRQ